MKAKVIYPDDIKVEKESNYSNSVKSDFLELEMAETSLSHYKMVFRKSGNGLNVQVEENWNNGEVVSHSKNFECMVRKLILSEKIIEAIRTKAIKNCAFFNENATEEDKKIGDALECILRIVNNYIDGSTRLEDDDVELICQAGAYSKENVQHTT